MIEETFSYPDYLATKKAIDDQSLNKYVWEAMVDWVKTQQVKKTPLKILEIGAGTGTMIERLLEAQVLRDCIYTAVELESSFRAIAFERLTKWSNPNNSSILNVSNEKRITLCNKNRIELEWINADILNIKNQLDNNCFDLLIGHAIIDLLPVPTCMSNLLAFLKPEGAFYFSLNFSGETLFFPTHPYDEIIIESYHRTMDERFPYLDWLPSKTGCNLGPWLNTQGHNLLAEGSSDWNLPINTLPKNTNFLFTSNILDTISNALKKTSKLNEWLKVRRQQQNTGELKLIITNKDCFGSKANNLV